MGDRWSFDDDILRLEALALVKAAERAVHSQPVHDCRYSVARLLTQIRRFASICLTSESALDGYQVNSTAATGSREDANA